MRVLFTFMCVLALGVMGCSETTGGDGGSAGEGGSGGVPSPGTLLSAEEIDPFGPGMNTWRVLYTSEAIDGTPIEVSGIVSAPIDPPTEGVRGVVGYARGTEGLFDACSPSWPPYAFFTIHTPALVNFGYVAVATNYEGLGTPGIHPYLVGESEGRGVLDIVRAAQQIEEAHAGNRAVVWGNSQGGHATLFAAEIAAKWAPDIELLGVIPSDPVSELEVLVEAQADIADARGLPWMLTVAYEAMYSGLNLEDVYDAETLGAIAGLVDQEACVVPFLEAARDVENAGFVANPADLPSWRERLVENSPGYERSDMPILLLQGSDDAIVPQHITDALFDRLCETGSQTDYRVFEGFGHGASYVLNFDTMLEWTNARFAGEAASDTCPD